MKTILLLKNNFTVALLLATSLLNNISAQSGSGGCSGSGPCSNNKEMKFKNPSYVNGSGSSGAGSLNSIYRFSSVDNNIDALVKVNDRSSSSVTLSDIDLDNTGFDNAFQPQIKYGNGSVNSSANWWMEFLVTFVTKNTSTPTAVSTFNATALDIDGDDNKLREWNSFYNPSSYVLELNTQLQISNLIVNLLNSGKTFTGVTKDYGGIDTTQTKIMATTSYTNVSVVKLRVGATTTGASSKTERMSSIWFKSFNYSTAITTLPVKLISFNALLNNNKVDLKWITASEKNVSHFVIEKSTDGINYSDAGMVFAYGNTVDEKNYIFSDKNINALQAGVIYYRLRSVDIDEKSELSEVRIIRITTKNEQSIAILTYPNPVSNEIRITVPATWQGKKVNYEILDNNGRIIIKKEPNSSSQTETLNVSQLSPGFYMVRANCGEETASQKIIKN